MNLYVILKILAGISDFSSCSTIFSLFSDNLSFSLSRFSVFSALSLLKDVDEEDDDSSEDSKYRFFDFFSLKLNVSVSILLGSEQEYNFSLLCALIDKSAHVDELEGESGYSNPLCDDAAVGLAVNTLVRNTRTASFEPKLPLVTQ